MSEKPDQWMPLYLGKYLADTMHLTTEQHGAYLLLLMAMWPKGGKLPADDASLASVARLSLAQWRKHKAVLLAFFTSDGTWLTQKRLAIEYAHAVRVNDKQRANGLKGGRPKKTQNEPMGSENGGEKETHGFVKHKPKQNPTETPLPRAIEATAKAKSASTEVLGECAPSAAPESEFSDREGYFEGHAGNAPTTLNPVTPFAAALSALGFTCTAYNPDLIAYHQAGGTVEHLQAIAQHPDCTGKAATYAIRFAHRELTTKPKPVPVGSSHRQPTSRHVAGAAGFIGALPHDHEESEIEGTAVLVQSGDRAGPGEPVPAEPRRLPGR